MAKDSNDHMEIEIVEAGGHCTLEELCVACNVEADWVADLVAHGALEPSGCGRAEWRFQSLTIASVAKAKRLERDLGLNTPGVALALELLDEIATLRARLRIYEDRRG